jgi:NitT/TauT family transport system substrate-binding protein
MWKPAALVATCLVAAAGCGERAAGRREAVVIATGSPVHTGLIQVAAAEGYFASEGLDVTLQAHQTGRLALAAVLAGDADLATCAETVVVFATLQGRQVSVLAAIASSTRTTALVAGDAIAAPKDLAGRRVGVARGTAAEFFLDTLLLRHGVDRGAVRHVDTKPDAMSDALMRGEVEAVAVWEPYLSLLQKRLGDRAHVFHVDDLYVETHDLVARPDFVQGRRAAAEKVLRALVRAEASFRKRPTAARRLVASKLALESSEADAVVSRFEYRVHLDQSLLVLMEEEARWAVRVGLVPKQATPNFLVTITPEPLLAVKPDAVGLVR